MICTCDGVPTPKILTGLETGMPVTVDGYSICARCGNRIMPPQS